MGKKSSGTKYVSKGVHSATSTGTRSAIRKDRSEGDRVINQQAAWLKGQNPWITIPNPNKAQTDSPFVRVKANTLWGTPKERTKAMFLIN